MRAVISHWLMLIAGGLLGFSVGIVVENTRMRGHDFPSFERGANAVMQHHKAIDNYGTFAYRAYVCSTAPDPQSEGDVKRILHEMELTSCGP